MNDVQDAALPATAAMPDVAALLALNFSFKHWNFRETNKYTLRTTHCCVYNSAIKNKNSFKHPKVQSITETSGNSGYFQTYRK